MVSVVGCLELDVHEVHGGSRRTDEEHLHRRIVKGDEVGEEIQIPGHKHAEEQDLGLPRDPGAGSGFPDLDEQDDDRQQVGEITG